MNYNKKKTITLGKKLPHISNDLEAGFTIDCAVRWWDPSDLWHFRRTLGEQISCTPTRAPARTEHGGRDADDARVPFRVFATTTRRFVPAAPQNSWYYVFNTCKLRAHSFGKRIMEKLTRKYPHQWWDVNPDYTKIRVLDFKIQNFVLLT